VAVREVRIYPDPVLKQRSEPVASLDAAALALADDLVDTMRSHTAVRGHRRQPDRELRRCVVVDVTGHRKAVSCHGLLVLFDPEVVSRIGGRGRPGRAACRSRT
jgi:peptide deformylase